MILAKKNAKNAGLFIGFLFALSIQFLSILSPVRVEAAPPRCYSHDGTSAAACQDAGVELEDDKCYTESRGGPNGVLTGYNETSCADPTDRDRDGNPGGAGGGGSTTEPEYVEDDCNEEELNPTNCGILHYLVIFINVLSGLAGVAIAASIVYGGIQYSAAGSDPQKVSAAKDRIRNALVALAFFIFGYGILNWLVPGGVI